MRVCVALLAVAASFSLAAGQLCPIVFDQTEHFDWTSTANVTLLFTNLTTFDAYEFQFCGSIQCTNANSTLVLGDHLNAFTHGFGPVFYQVLSTKTQQPGCPIGAVWTEVVIYCSGFLPIPVHCDGLLAPSICSAYVDKTAQRCKAHVDVIAYCPGFVAGGPRQGFDVVTSNDIVVLNGVVQSAWSPATPFAVSADTDSLMLFVSSAQADDAAVLQNVYIEQSSDDALDTTFDFDLFPVPQTVTNEGAFLPIEFACYGIATVTVTITFELAGPWAQMPVVINKECNSNLGRFDTVLFVFFLFLVSVCLCGTFYQYKVHKRRGCMALPCADCVTDLSEKMGFSDRSDVDRTPFARQPSALPRRPPAAPARAADSTATVDADAIHSI